MLVRMGLTSQKKLSTTRTKIQVAMLVQEIIHSGYKMTSRHLKTVHTWYIYWQYNILVKSLITFIGRNIIKLKFLLQW